MPLAEKPSMLAWVFADVEFVGIIAQAGTLEARRCRTELEQDTGVEISAQGFFGVLTREHLSKILDERIPADARDWLFAGDRGKELRFIVVTMTGFEVATAPLSNLSP